MVDVPYSSPDDIVCFRHTAGYGIIGLINKMIYRSTEKYYTPEFTQYFCAKLKRQEDKYGVIH